MDTRKTIISVIVASLSIAALFSETAKPYSYYVCTSNGKIVKWPDKKINWRAGKNSFNTTALHEMGHALGIAHADNTYNIMGVDVAWYISTNSNITTHDKRIRTRTMTLNRGKAYTTEHTVTIPSSGYEVDDELYLGVIVDYTGKISEFSNFNNATYLPILIVN